MRKSQQERCDFLKKAKIELLVGVILFLTATGITLYPLLATRYHAAHQSKIQQEYQQIVEQQDNTEKEKALELAKQYNETLQPGAAKSFSQDSLLWASEDYVNQLDITGTGIMGYIQIPSIGVNLPIFHGTSDAVLSKGVGHLLGSSLPVGGLGTHTVLTGHSGMASQKMFTDLEQLKMGDVFYLDVLGERLTYQVEDTHVVLPYDTSQLEIVPGEDYCTLVTCTPYGVNTHRLLVRGSRIATEEKTEEVVKVEPHESTWEREYRKGICIAIGIVGVVGVVALAGWLVRRYYHGKMA